MISNLNSLRVPNKRSAVKFVRSVWLAGVLSIVLLCSPVMAGKIDIHLGIMLPPLIKVRTAPTMVFIGEAGIYTAVGIDYDLFFIDGRYFYLHGGNWFWSAGYGGPWGHLKSRSLPPGLRRFKISKLRHFRAAEFKRFKNEGSHYKGRKIIAGKVKGLVQKSKSLTKHRKKKHSPGKGRGRK